MKKDKSINLFRKQWVISVMACLLLFTQWHLVQMSKTDDFWVSVVNNLTYTLLSCAFCVIFLIGCCCKAYLLKRSDIKRLLGNVLNLSWLTIFFIVLFATELSWLADISKDIIIEGKISSEYWSLISVIFSIIGLWLLFPEREPSKKKTSKRTTLLTGFSVSKNKDGRSYISGKNIELFLLPFQYKKGETTATETKKDQNFCIEKVLILTSSTLFDSKIEITEHESIIKKESQEKLFEEEYNKCVDSYCKNKENKEKLAEVKNAFSNFLKSLIKSSGKMEIIYSEETDYNDFKPCYEIASDFIKGEEKKTENTIVYTSPGSSIVSGVLTALAIRGDRMMVYTEQANNTLRILDIDVFTINNLLEELAAELG